ncbi:putative glycoside hydrolase [Ideonella sp. BN130291]|uniref:putative glycoside hydrolase n=1 Tax=Ideonella sp. BN130291 TaxID=3112940 RepID=UPI002E2610A7|nr:putative glycoside hydrolase [Ideonella sp. BN130291]
MSAATVASSLLLGPSGAASAASAGDAGDDTSLGRTRVAALYYGRIDRTEQRSRAASFALVVLNMWPSMGRPTMQATIDAIRRQNPNAKIAQYVVLNELQPVKEGEDQFPLVQAVERNGWWARDRAGRRVQWTAAFKAHEVNLTRWAPADAEGRRWPELKADADTGNFFGALKGLNYAFVDNVFDRPRVEADWKGTGENQGRNDAEVQSAYRQGYVDYWQALRARNPGLQIMVNADHDLGAPEYRGQVEGAFLECQIGRNWSIEGRVGWAAMMNRYRSALAHTRGPRDVVLQACGGADDVELMRYGLASALLADGYYTYSVPGQAQPPWFDDYALSIGRPVEPEPQSAAEGGVWRRRYSGGIVLVNPGPFSATVEIEPGYRRADGPVNERKVQLPARRGVLLVRTAR